MSNESTTSIPIQQPRPQGDSTETPQEVSTATGARCFPLNSIPFESYKSRPRNFGAGRPKGRKHAGIDLYHPTNSPIRAIADGVVVLPSTGFYLGTNELEIHHPGIGIVRYGEISATKTVKLKRGEKVKAGQVIAYVGYIKKLKMSMLHFELYAGTAKGPLTVKSNKPFQRRTDLMNPTELMDELAKASFG